MLLNSTSAVHTLLYQCSPSVHLSDCCWWGAVSQVMTAHPRPPAVGLQPGGCCLARHTTSRSLPTRMMSVWWGVVCTLLMTVSWTHRHSPLSVLSGSVRKEASSGCPASGCFPGTQMKRWEAAFTHHPLIWWDKHMHILWNHASEFVMSRMVCSAWAWVLTAHCWLLSTFPGVCLSGMFPLWSREPPGAKTNR